VIVYVYDLRARLHVIAGKGRLDKDVDNYATLQNERRCPRKSYDRRR
jgi:hypothetical protein